MSTTVLICDDSKLARRQLARSLPEDWDIKVEFALDGVDCIKQIKLIQPEILFLDLNMPEMDGYTLTTEIKKDASLKGLHVVLHSSLSGVFNEAMVERVGADAFIPKFDPDELSAAVILAVKGQEK